jgi:hypothetical protein
VLDSRDREFQFASRSGLAGDQATGEFQVRKLLHARSKAFEDMYWDMERKKRERKEAGVKNEKQKKPM